MKLSVPPSHSIHAGDFVRITQPCTKEWIQALGMHDFGGDRHGPSWRPGSRDLHWIRQVTKIQENELWLDAPLPLAMEADKNL